VALEKQSILDRARALNDIEIRKALEREREEERHPARLQRHQCGVGTTPERNHHIPYINSIEQYMRVDSVTRTVPSSSDEANSSDDSQDDQDRSEPECTPSPYAVGRGRGVTDLRVAINSPWESRFRDLVLFKREHGHCNVPRRYKNNPKLGVWVCSLRQQMARGTLKMAKMDRLNEIGFKW